MYKKYNLKLVMLLLMASFLMTGCFTQQHVIGDGAEMGEVEEARQ